MAAAQPPRNAEGLQAAISGEVFMPGEAGYDEARQAWNLGVDQRPAVVVIAESADDVARAVGYAGKHEMRVAPQGTGHDAGALEPLDDAMLLRTSRMRGVRTEGKSPDVGREPHAQPDVAAAVRRDAQAVRAALADWHASHPVRPASVAA